MKTILVLVLVVITLARVTYADTWARPVEQLYLSQNKQFVAQVTPAKDKSPATLKVFLVRGLEGWISWQCTLGNEGAPQDVFVTDDGRYVVTVNENNSRVHGGFGDYVIAFYNKAGVIKNYSLEQILHYPDDIDEREFTKLFSRTVSGRQWAYRPMFLDDYGGHLCFCARLLYGNRWLAWEVSTGEEVKMNEKMVERWNEKARLWALREIEAATPYYWYPYNFLGELKNPDDRPLIEKLLSDENFGESNSFSSKKMPTQDQRAWRLLRCTSSSRKRLVAEQILAKWDGKPTAQPGLPHPPLYHLGKLEGIVTLPKTDDPNRATLWIYLVPGTVPKDQWHKQPPVQRLAVSFSDYSLRNYDLEHTQKFPFGITGVTPGEYWMKAVLDKTKPFSKSTDKFYVPQVGDYESILSTVIHIKAGEMVDNIIIDCTREVGGEVD